MGRKRYSDEDILKLLCEIELKLADGNDVRLACRSVGVSDATLPGVAKQILRSLAAFQNFIQHFFGNCDPCFLLKKHGPDQPYTEDPTLSLRGLGRGTTAFGEMPSD
ncbi:hypothetical protein [Primorskyibacter sp. S87]|uniref:hypothetical protein n=1 Tax=Primorskyibacter sp. S87 TaxID=3415126 RepID=UPI003C7BC868